ncbi:MAG: hypothetical protein HY220_04455 [Candidatus Sungbacteria bacterium]|uniref:Uncharacterized protein n=1 Tax=Candidatus Sungiibacteriota bacterium TaxID=2750080 RepID=A0A9D6LSH7_9BACT|nr:hypothetical protein [Candidatus Sungbacteria bacterium]
MALHERVGRYLEDVQEGLEEIWKGYPRLSDRLRLRETAIGKKYGSRVDVHATYGKDDGFYAVDGEQIIDAGYSTISPSRSGHLDPRTLGHLIEHASFWVFHGLASDKEVARMLHVRPNLDSRDTLGGTCGSQAYINRSDLESFLKEKEKALAAAKADRRPYHDTKIPDKKAA